MSAGWSGWQWHQRSQAAEASALYETLSKAAQENDAKALREVGQSVESYEYAGEGHTFDAAWPVMMGRVADFLDEYFTHEAVKGALSPGGVIGAWGGPMTPGSAYVLLHHRMGDVVPHGGWAFVGGGMGALSEAIASSACARRWKSRARCGRRAR